MKLTRLYGGVDSHTYFEDLGEIALQTNGAIGKLSSLFAVTSMLIHEYPANMYQDWHTPHLGCTGVIFLEGQQEIETSLGVKRIFGYGNMLLVEDVNSSGHRTRAIGDKGGKSIILVLGNR